MTSRDIATDNALHRRKPLSNYASARGSTRGAIVASACRATFASTVTVAIVFAVLLSTANPQMAGSGVAPPSPSAVPYSSAAGRLSSTRSAIGSSVRPALAPAGGIPAVPHGATAIGPVPTSEKIRIDIALKPRNPGALANFVTSVSTPSSSMYRHYLVPGQFGRVFGATPASVRTVRYGLAKIGLPAGTASSNGLVVSFQATVARVQAALHTKLQRYRMPSGRIAFANVSPPLLADTITPYIEGIIGLDTLTVPKPISPGPPASSSSEGLPSAEHRPKTTLQSQTAPQPQATAGPQPCTSATDTAQSPPPIKGDATYLPAWTANQIASAYGFDSAYTKGALGNGQTLALFETGGPYLSSDISAYESCYGIHTAVNPIAVDGGASGQPNSEATEDIEIAAGFDPQATIDVYEAPASGTAFIDEFSRIAADDSAQVVSVSYGWCESAVAAGSEGGMAGVRATNTIMEQMAAQGQTVLIAAGDTGSETCLRGEQAGPFSTVSCPLGSTFCMASDFSGNSFTFNGSSWSFAGNPSGGAPLGVSCPSTSLCMAVDAAGNAYSWNGASWSSPQVLDPKNMFYAISCTTSDFCAAVDNGGNAFMYNGSSWSGAYNIDGSTPLTSVSCASSTFCLAVDKGNDAITWDGSSWSPPIQIDYQHEVLASISCPSSSLCVAVDAFGQSIWYENGSWQSPIPIITDGGGFTSVDCLSANFCTAVDTMGYAYVYINGQNGSKDVDGTTTLTSVSCASENFCVAVDVNGNAIFDNGSGPSAPQLVDLGNATLNVSALASDPYVTAVGGTTLESVGSPPQESVWNNAMSTPDGGAGGGGISTMWPMPSWQQDSGVPGVVSSLSSGKPCGAASSSYCRELPDVSASANWYQGGYVLYFNGTWGVNGGTSAATPTWASLLTLANETCGTRIGFASPLLYRIAAEDPSAFNNITSGNNDYAGTNNGLYPAASGSQRYSMAGGLGSPNGAVLLGDICSMSIPSGTYHPTQPTRILDTRCATQPSLSDCAAIKASYPSNAAIAALHGGTPVNVKVAGSNLAVPAGAVGVVLNVTAVSASSPTYLTVYPGNAKSPPVVSNVNVANANPVANLVEVALPAGGSDVGTVDVYNHSGLTDVIIDVEGYVAPPGSSSPAGAGTYSPLDAPLRVVDTRCATDPKLYDCAGIATNAPANSKLPSLPPDGSETIAVTGVGGTSGVPASGVSAVELNVTAVNGSAQGFYTIYPSGTALPVASNLNWTPGEVVANRVIVPVGSNGDIVVKNGSGQGYVDLVVDISGWFASGTSSAQAGGTMVPLPPVRVLDTRCATEGSLPDCAGIAHIAPANSSIGLVSAGKAITVDVAGSGLPVPAGTGAVILNVTALGTGGSGFLSVNPVSYPPSTSDVNWVVGNGQAVPNLVTATLTTDGTITIYASSQANVIVDVMGYISGIAPLPPPVNTPIQVSPSSLPGATVGTAYSTTLSATGGDAGPYSWKWVAASGSSLPPGLALCTGTGTTCSISGTPSAVGTFSFSVTATDSAGNQGSRQYNLDVAVASSGGGGSWSAPKKIDSNDGLYVSCTSSSFCAVVDESGDALTWNGSSWSNPVSIDSANAGGLYGVSCTSTTFCMAVGNGAVTWNGSSWSQPVSSSADGPVSCRSPSFCVAVNFNGDALTWNGSSWSNPVSVDPNGGGLYSVSCASTTFCAAADAHGNVVTYNGSSWSAPSNIASSLYSVSCVSTSFCMATGVTGVTGDAGTVAIWNGSSWSASQTVDTSAGSYLVVSCASASFCAIGDANGNVLTWNGSSWSKPLPVDPSGGGFSSISCPASNFCVAVDQLGGEVTY
ncbi:MAG: protease pro-enzyme activation domain-containing protein [Acidimicrobiales bacterium]